MRGAADLDRLIDHFFFEYTRRHGRPELHLTRAARSLLHAHDWPSNVRELEHCVESAVVLAPGPAIDRENLSIGPITHAEAPGLTPSQSPEVFQTGLEPLKDAELAYIEHILTLCDGNRGAAARMLEIGRNTLLRTLED